MASSHAEKTDAIVIRQANFSESSKVVTFFTRDYGKLSTLAKGAKRLKGPFEGALDLLAHCRVVFLPKHDALSLLTEAQLVTRFRPTDHNLNRVYAGYYIAELLDGLTSERDQHVPLFENSIHTLDLISHQNDLRKPVVLFELALLKQIGLLPILDQCQCGTSIQPQTTYTFWVSQGVLLCPLCRQPDIPSRDLSGGTLALLRILTSEQDRLINNLQITDRQYKEIRGFLNSSISAAMDRKPRMLSLLSIF